MKKIIILTSKGGGGHLAVSDALKIYLGSHYKVHAVNTFSDVIHPLDVIRKITFGKYDWIRFYNDFLTKKWFRLLSACQVIGAYYMRIRSGPLVQLLTAYLKKENADMVISVVPLINAALIKSTKNLGIPLIIVPTDLDATIVINGINQPQEKHFRFTCSFDDDTIAQTIAPAQINKKQLVVTGFPIRPVFFTHKDIENIKHKYDVLPNKPVILLLMGYRGSNALYDFAQELAKIKVAIHVLICTGKNTNVVRKIRTVSFPPHITTTIIGFTEHISDLMSISDVFIGKSGSVSVCEALYMNLPLFLDATSGTLEWEKFNHDFVTQHNFGLSIKSEKDIAHIVTKFFPTLHIGKE